MSTSVRVVVVTARAPAPPTCLVRSHGRPAGHAYAALRSAPQLPSSGRNPISLRLRLVAGLRTWCSAALRRRPRRPTVAEHLPVSGRGMGGDRARRPGASRSIGRGGIRRRSGALERQRVGQIDWAAAAGLIGGPLTSARMTKMHRPAEVRCGWPRTCNTSVWVIGTAPPVHATSRTSVAASNERTTIPPRAISRVWHPPRPLRG